MLRKIPLLCVKNLTLYHIKRGGVRNNAETEVESVLGF